MRVAYVQEWLEHERGWGTRHDGFSLARDRDESRRHTAGLVARMRADEAWLYLGLVPDAYSAPAGDPVAVEVSEVTWEKLAEPRFLNGRIIETKIGKRVFEELEA